MTDHIIDALKSHGRVIVASLSLAVAFGLSVQFGDRGTQFDLEQTTLSASESEESSESEALSDLTILNRGLLQIKDNYVEPDRIEAHEMLVAALEEVQNALPPVVVRYEPSRKNLKTIRVEAHEKTKTFDVEKLESLWEMSFRLKSIFKFVESHVDPPEDETFRDVEYDAINGILTTLDPHSTLLPPKHYKEMQTQTGGEFGGLGIVISIRDGRLTVISPIDGTPAASKGIKAQDKIVRIGDQSTVNMKLNEAVSMLRGKPGTDIDIWVDRKTWSEPRKFTITRDVITIQSVNSEPLGDKVGYVRIKNFQANTHPDLKKHLSKLKEKMGGMQGLVLDLRDNPGGLLNQAIKVSDLFLEKGTIVSTVGAGNKKRDKKVATKSGTEPNYPMIVLVNAGSASASEIVSGALQNHDRALVMGDTTFGKGTVQVLYEFPDQSALKLTVAQYLTPGGVSIQSRGITPDLRLIPATIGKDRNVNMFLSDTIREEDLESHLSNKASDIAKQEGVVFIRYLKEMMSPEKRRRLEASNEFNEDFQIRLGQQLLTAAGEFEKRPKLLEALQPELEKIYDRELEVIREKLAEYDIDWAKGPTPQSPDVSFEVETSGEDDTIRAGEKVTLEATLTNEGDEPIHQIKAISESAHNALDDLEFLFGRLEPGDTRTWSVDVQIPKETPTRHELVEFQISDDQRNFGEPRTQPIRIEGLKRPQFAFNYEIDDGNGDGVFQIDETVNFRVFVHNFGRADSAETRVYLKNLSEDTVYLEKGRAKLESVPKDETKSVEFKFRVKEKPDEQDHVGLQVDVYDSIFREFVQKKLKLPFVNGEGASLETASGVATIQQGPTKLFAGAHPKTDVIGTVEAGRTLPVTGRTKEWLKLDLDRQTGWIQRTYTNYDASGRVESGESPGISWRYFQAPDIELRPASRMTSKEAVELEGTVRDNGSVKDYYIFVYHREDTAKIESNKVLYTEVGKASTELSTTIPLFEGMNRIAVVARDDDDMSMTESTYVYRR